MSQYTSYTQRKLLLKKGKQSILLELEIKKVSGVDRRLFTKILNKKLLLKNLTIWQYFFLLEVFAKI